MNPPPGGPDDEGPPRLLSVSPDSGAVGVRGSGVTFTFDEVVSDRMERDAIEALVLVSPRDGAPRISWRRSGIVVRPRHGLRPNTTYSVTLLPGITDLRGNRSVDTRTVIFSTGPTIATQAITGRTWDWTGERAAVGAIVEAVSVADSSTYVAASDSVGTFIVGPLPAGSYRVQAFVDGNRNRGRDRGEAWDSSSVTLTTLRAVTELYLAVRDSIPPRIASIQALDSLHLAVELDRPADPSRPLAPTNFRLRRSDSTEMRVATVQTRRDYDRALESERRRVDSLQRDSVARADTAAARRDSVARAQPPVVAPAPGAPRPTEPPRPGRPAPPATFVLTLAEPVRPTATYRLYLLGVRGLTGMTRDSDRSFTVPAAPTAAPGDSARRTTPPAAAPVRRP